MPPRNKKAAERAHGEAVSSKQTYIFKNSEDLRRSLKAQDENGLIETLKALRNQLTVKHGELSISPGDERLQFLRAWLESPQGAGAQELLNIWDSANSRQLSLLSLIVAVLSAIISLLSFHYTDYSLAVPLIRTLLSSNCTHKLNSYLGSSHTELILVTLKLFNSLSDYAGGRERKAVLEAFAWDTKSLPRILHMRRKSKGDDMIDILSKPDIRTLYVLFILSFVDSTTQASVKTAFLEQRRETFISIFKGLTQDPYSLVRRVLEVCWTGVWSDPKLRRTVKVSLFGESTIFHLLKLYDRAAPEGQDAEHVPADVVHHFLLAICTHPGIGICFRDSGWYLRETDDAEDTTKSTAERSIQEGSRPKGGRIYNKILANVVKSLKVNDDPRQQELAMKIFAACPELVAGFWPAAALTLEPRLSLKWIANVAFFGTVISLPVPQSSFLIPENGEHPSYRPAPPPLFSTLENIIPSINMRAHLTRGLQSPSAMVQHCTALALAKCMYKYEAVVQAFTAIEQALEEDEEGQWRKRRLEVEKEVRKRVPDFQVIVGFAQKWINLDVAPSKESDTTGAASGSAQQQALPNPTKRAMLAESAYRLLWLYHRCTSSLVSETRFDAGKLVHGLQRSQEGSENTTSPAADSLDKLRQLHLLRLLQDSDQFVWSARIDASRSNLSVLLTLHIETPVTAIKAAITSLLQHVLSSSILFQHDSDEVMLWLESLPKIQRVDAKAPDGTPLTDERQGVVSFLDDCVLRCMKTPYRYLEESQSLWTQADGGKTSVDTANIADEAHILPSPLLMTVIEQLAAKLKAHILSPSDALGVVTYARKLIWRLAGKMSNLSFLHACAEKLAELVQPAILFPDSPVLTSAILREVELVSRTLKHLQSPEFSSTHATDPTAQDFLTHVEASVASSNTEKTVRAYEVVDWLRLIQPVMHSTDVTRLLDVVEQLDDGALGELLETVDVSQDMPLDENAAGSLCRDLNGAGFALLFTHCSNDRLEDISVRHILVGSLFRRSVHVADVTRAVQYIQHRMSPSALHANIVRDLFFLLAGIITTSRTHLKQEDLTRVAQSVIQSTSMKQYYLQSLSSDARQGLDAFLKASLAVEQDRPLVAGHTAFWALTIRDSVFSSHPDQIATATLWLKYMDIEDCFALLESVVGRADVDQAEMLELIEALLQVVASSTSQVRHITASRASTLLRLRPLLLQSVNLESTLASVTAGFLPLGYNGQCSPTGSRGRDKLSELTRQSELQWTRRLADVLPGVDVAMFFDQETWSTSTVDIISSRMYRSPQARMTVFHWLDSGKSATRDIHQVAQLLHAYFDSSITGEPETQATSATFVPLFNRLISEDPVLRGSERIEASLALFPSCIAMMFEKLVSLRHELSLAVKKRRSPHKTNKVSLSIVAAWARVIDIGTPDAFDPVDVLLEQGLKWAVDRISEQSKVAESTSVVLEHLVKLLPHASADKNHLVEPVLTVIIQSRLSDAEALRFARKLIQQTSLKPAVVNRFIQTIVQHADLYQSYATSDAVQDAIAHLLHVLFHLHPNNTCQPTHVEPLLPIYRGTLMTPDRLLLAIFRLFERTRRVSVSSLFNRWSASGDAVSSNALEAIQTLDPSLTFKTCLTFPQWRSFDDDQVEKRGHGHLLYDPVFVSLLFAQVLADKPPSTALEWLQVLRTNVVSLLIRALSSDDELMRQIAFGQIASLYKCMDTADLQEQPYILHILNMLKDLISMPPGSECPRLPAYTTLLLAHALRGVFYPSNFIYPLTARFLLQRPEVDAHDVPMLYGMLYSSSEQWKKERGWMLRFLSDGLVGTPEWRILKRRHTWDLLASLFQSEQSDRALRRGILEVLASITCNAKATTSLVLRHALLAWIEMQLRHAHSDESIAWIKILENVLTVVDAGKIEAATNGEWRYTLCRCISTLLDTPAAPREITALAIQVLLRMSVLMPNSTQDLISLISQCLTRLRAWEEELEVPADGYLPQKSMSEAKTSAAPHNSQGLFDLPPMDSVCAWGECIKSLWRVVMSMETRSPEWDALTTRLLLWRSFAGHDEETGEWARRQVVQALRT
ncbi:hypothetical protein CERSUDRAFT_94218 [Gelatoporia subvermispora B]|uniref:Nucleolar pre-ribosomal-associated protein 1 C-terminal domain-containing protein n=1 Tax=Ceriporiopsis subvermispora (strain B) TaxID=914234 RepID=M2RIN4_CERS8|nr:hypothetical protein CERSUDRAFT_94218 [Gelatoporia subvermispora B]